MSNFLVTFLWTIGGISLYLAFIWIACGFLNFNKLDEDDD